jgi:hypothetical protein
VRPTMARDAARRRELPKKQPQAVLVRRYLRVNFRVRAFEIGTGVERWAAMTGTRDVNDVGIMLFDQAVQMNVDDLAAGTRRLNRKSGGVRRAQTRSGRLGVRLSWQPGAETLPRDSFQRKKIKAARTHGAYKFEGSAP